MWVNIHIVNTLDVDPYFSPLHIVLQVECREYLGYNSKKRLAVLQERDGYSRFVWRHSRVISQIQSTLWHAPIAFTSVSVIENRSTIYT